MNLDKFYSLRTDFTIIGLTGRVGAGCSEIANKLADVNFVNKIPTKATNTSGNVETLKHNICLKYLKNEDNWKAYQVIKYKNVLLFHLIHDVNKNLSEVQGIAYIEEFYRQFIKIIGQNGSSVQSDKKWKNRLDLVKDSEFTESLRPLIFGNQILLAGEMKFGCYELNECLKNPQKSVELFDFFFGDEFNNFADAFFDNLNKYNAVLRTRLIHDLANNLRSSGSVINKKEESLDLTNIYTIAETINRIIKSYRTQSQGVCKIVIDSLKNSLELMYFKEKYSGFYMVSARKEEGDRKEYVRARISKNGTNPEKLSDVVTQTLNLDNAEYKCNDFRDGRFSSPDIENCIQKSDYHIYIPSTPELDNQYLDLDSQILKLVSLINQPGIVTPTAIERTMQIAYSARFNSGCISRQVGAVVTDAFFSIKSVGWNDVPQGQTPCNLRDVNNLVSENPGELFSAYEKTNNDFIKKMRNEISSSDQSGLGGKNCPFCFKSFQNAIENQKNQVHTRSLHAEENAMLQITKYGGQGLKGGNLFTTASPCELCSKKAYQLGIKNIYYIDQYPGISQEHILKGGTDPLLNPKLIMFQGAVGRAYHKLYEPFMAYKDEVSILTNINPKPLVDDQIKSLPINDELKEKILQKISMKNEKEKILFLEKFLGINLETVV